jgi:hypothetical protein
MYQNSRFKIDGPVKSRKCFLSVIPAKAGIRAYQLLTTALNPVFQRGDDFYETIKIQNLKQILNPKSDNLES